MVILSLGYRNYKQAHYKKDHYWNPYQPMGGKSFLGEVVTRDVMMNLICKKKNGLGWSYLLLYSPQLSVEREREWCVKSKDSAPNQAVKIPP